MTLVLEFDVCDLLGQLAKWLLLLALRLDGKASRQSDEVEAQGREQALVVMVASSGPLQ
jgi:hypothetical protein